MRKYFEKKFIPVDEFFYRDIHGYHAIDSKITKEAIWTTEPFEYLNGEIVWCNQFGFDPFRPCFYLKNKDYEYSDDKNVLFTGRHIVSLQCKLANKYTKILEKEGLILNERTKFELAYKALDAESDLENRGEKVCEKFETKVVRFRILSASNNWYCGFNAETLDDAAKKFVVFINDIEWVPGKKFNWCDYTITRKITRQVVYDVNGERIVAVYTK